MLKFAALEKKAKDKEEKEMERKMSNRATETSALPAQVHMPHMSLQVSINLLEYNFTFATKHQVTYLHQINTEIRL